MEEFADCTCDVDPHGCPRVGVRSSARACSGVETPHTNGNRSVRVFCDEVSQLFEPEAAHPTQIRDWVVALEPYHTPVSGYSREGLSPWNA